MQNESKLPDSQEKDLPTAEEHTQLIDAISTQIDQLRASVHRLLSRSEPKAPTRPLKQQ